MIILKIAWRDIMRQRTRTWLTIAAIAFCTVSVLLTMAFARGEHQQIIQSGVSTFPGHFEIQKQGYLNDPALTKSFTPPAKLIKDLENDGQVQGVAPRVIYQGLASSDQSTAGVMIVGADPALEARATTLARKVSAGRFLTAADGKSVVLGATLAENLKVKVGDEIEIMAQSFYGSLQLRFYKVLGIIRTGSPDFDQALLIMPLGELQSFLEMGGEVSEISVVLKSPRARDRVEALARSELQGPAGQDLVIVPWEKIMPEMVEFVMLDNAGAVLYLAILVVVVAFVVLLTITMSVLERMREFGVLLAIGTRPRRIFQIIMTESFLMGIVGTAIGLAIATIPSWYFSVHPINISSWAAAAAEFGMEPYLRTILMPLMYYATVVIMMIITMAVSIFPAVRAARIKPVEALRYV
jgi:putative ABC transport system permease protein